MDRKGMDHRKLNDQEGRDMSDYGKVLRVNLSEGTVGEEDVKEKLLRDYIGGRGYASKVLYDELPANTDPLGPENKLIFCNGPLTGRGAPAAGRYMVVTKSPLTGYIASSNSGGHWGAELAKSGWFMLVIEGKASEPMYLWIKDDKVELRKAGPVWGMDTTETTDRLLSEVGDDKARVSCIGPAGENLSKLAAIINEKGRAAGRSGVGAVMGSKNLKAIVVRGTGKPYVADPEGLKKALKNGVETLKKHPVTGEGLPAYGTAVLVNIINQMGAYPYKNWQEAYMEGADSQSGEKLADTYLEKRSSCFGCPIGCGRVSKLEGKTGEGPEYESIFAFGSCCGVEPLEPIIEANFICNELGLDTISAGVTIAAAMELYEKGYIKKEELQGGPELKFGNGEALVYWIRKMGACEGLGAKLAEGSYRLGEMYGHPEFSMSVKKQEMPAYDARAIQGIGLNYALSNRGGCHVRGYLISPEVLGTPEKLDPTDTKEKPKWTMIFHDLTAAIDSSGMCLFTSFALGAEDYAEYLKAGTGFDYTSDEIMKCGERIWNLERVFNLREGLTSAEDTLPLRLLEDAIPEGPSKGMVSHVREMVPEYYKLRGWDEKGVPSDQKLNELGLK
jgi:aldehyde:ferredoxin oxidoreductase